MQHWKKTIITFITSQIVSLIGTLFVSYAITWYVTLETQSGLMMMISILCGFVPGMFLAPFAGVWADRFSRRKLIIFADAMIAIVTLITVIIFILGYREIWLLFVISIFRSSGQAIQQPAVGAVLPQIVPEEKLMRVQGIHTGINSAMMIVAPIVAATLISIWSIEYIFLIDVVTAAIAIFILITFIRFPRHVNEQSGGKVDYLGDMKQGIHYINHHPFLVVFFVLVAGINILFSPLSFLTPLQVVRLFGDNVFFLSAIEIAFSIGMLLGGVILAWWGGFKNRTVSIIVATMIVGASAILLGIIPIFWPYLVVMGVIGLVVPLLNTPSMVIIQRKVDPQYMGRVMSVLTIVTSAMNPLGMLIFGPLADIVSLESILIVTGGLLILVGLTFFFSPALMKAGVFPKKPSNPVEIN